MKNVWQKIRNTAKGHFSSKSAMHSPTPNIKTSQMSPERTRKIEAGAKDFAERFEGVMKELANG